MKIVCQLSKTLKSHLISALIIVVPYWNVPFEIMCDASDFVVGVVLGQRRNKLFHTVYYGCRTLNATQLNYTTSKKELFAVVFAFDKFCSYLIGFKVTIFSDHSALKYLFKKDAKQRLIRWVLLLK